MQQKLGNRNRKKKKPWIFQTINMRKCTQNDMTTATIGNLKREIETLLIEPKEQ